ncbi:ferredoxin [Nocardia jiangxiensis]|uniref:ferredoxin n=1 Tax=Nocardia jiangxiensis TaxID=282685 RepID=UPI0005931CFB|nr:ferredoxin [Nocardia jiangxiensis]
MPVVRVDSDRCQGHARCLAFAPDTFDFDDEGYASVPEDRDSYVEIPDSVRQAAAGCPERAIAILGDTAS